MGVEFCEPAVLDARKNAALNAVTNAQFVAGAAENTLADFTKLPLPATATHAVAVVDPPRAGLHSNVIKVLRVCKSIKRFVYVSCNPMGSFVDDSVK